jgi:hypothetical protein
MEQEDGSLQAKQDPLPEPLTGFIEKEVELRYYDNYTSQTADGKYLASCARIHHCSCDCNKCTFWTFT